MSLNTEARRDQIEQKDERALETGRKRGGLDGISSID